MLFQYQYNLGIRSISNVTSKWVHFQDRVNRLKYTRKNPTTCYKVVAWTTLLSCVSSIVGTTMKDRPAISLLWAIDGNRTHDLLITGQMHGYERYRKVIKLSPRFLLFSPGILSLISPKTGQIVVFPRQSWYYKLIPWH